MKRDFVSKYKQSILGPIWFLLQPLFITIVFTAVFSRVAQISTDSLPAPLFYMAGLLGWNYFQHTFNSVAGTFLSNMHIFSKVYFPRIVVPLSMVGSNIVTFVVQTVVFLAFYSYLKLFGDSGHTFGMSPYALLFPVVLLQTMTLSLGVGLCAAAITAKYRDLIHVMGVLTQVWLYATPVIYPVSKVPIAWRSLLALNPMTGIVETFRWLLLGKGTLSPTIIGSSVAVTTIIFVVGLLAFRQVERTVVDIV